ncbi:alkylation response protein AidB-like acyl-CoA dehydrogenase [Deinococcus metalli]|uniref:Acyl-CoA dehydrogenase YdbM n=1 Tax=Deinococcus metalli TaxID=1141878 RepID=A0A7W8KG00_9DEIO|nr:acyl-CoA dehydrogenase family protein [Deinococcus metalli]MBB5375854.1 alkylation response protein AidB-like acyl-CoA dehydrogenase [Deinococcus metalli]GHF36534.1 putative acyl-CoA dehydrogenase YdbM [Deinococcus metalli]
MTATPSAPEFTPEQAEVVERTAAAIREHAPACEAAQDVTPEAAHALSASGYTRLTLPADAGGLGATLTQFALAQLDLGRADASLALVLAMHGHVTGSAFQGRSLPPALLDAVAAAGGRGELLNALASEPELGSPSRGGLPRTVAVPDGTGFESAQWLVTGRKTWSTGARALRWALVSAATPDGRVGRYWIDLHGEGVCIEPTWRDALSLRGSGSHDVVFTRAPAALQAPPSGAHPAGSAWFWTAVAATYLGVGEAALDALSTYARERVPTALGAPIATLPRVQENVGRIAADLLAARTLLLHATAAWDLAPDAAAIPLIGAAKAVATNAAVDATDRAVRTAGGGALTDALPLGKLLRDARAGLTHPPGEDPAFTAYGAAVLGDLDRA